MKDNPKLSYQKNSNFNNFWS